MTIIEIKIQEIMAIFNGGLISEIILVGSLGQEIV